MVAAKASSSPTAPTNKDLFPCSNGTTSFINLEQGDPAVFGSFWKKVSDDCTVVIKGWDLMSYMSDTSSVCWFMMPELRDAIHRLHLLVGNAVTEDRHIVVGNGSTQLFQAALFGLSPMDSALPINVVAAAPYYSEYKDEIEIVRPGLYQWGGDAKVYDKNEPYIEVVTSPNNPDGNIREPVALQNSRAQGKLVHDLAYYWPQYTPITHKVDQDIMLFTFSKCTGHAGSRIGWAIVKDIEVARKMTRFIQMSSIGVSKESQTRVAKIMGVICDGYQDFGSKKSEELFFEYSKRILRERWDKLRAVIEQTKLFTLSKYPKAYCNFTHESSESYPGFVWLKSEGDIQDCGAYLRKLKVLARGGKRFGVDPMYARVSLLSTDQVFDEFLTRLSNATTRDRVKEKC